MKQMDLVIVGCGDIGNYMGLAARLSRKVRPAACVDTNEERARAFAGRHSLPFFYTDYREMLDKRKEWNPSGEGAAVYLGVPHVLHAPMTLQAVEKQIPVFCEKPVTTTWDDALMLRNLTSRSPVPVGINYQYRYDSRCRTLISRCRSGKIGRLNYARVRVPWLRDMSYFTNSPWHASLEKSGGGTLLTQASHFMDIALLALGGTPVRAGGILKNYRFKDVEVEDTAFGWVELDNGTLIHVESTMASVPGGAAEIEILGDRGRLIYENRFFPRLKHRGRGFVAGGPIAWTGMQALMGSLNGFADWVMGRGMYETPLAEALGVFRAVHGIYEAARTGHIVDLSREFPNPADGS